MSDRVPGDEILERIEREFHARLMAEHDDIHAPLLCGLHMAAHHIAVMHNAGTLSGTVDEAIEKMNGSFRKMTLDLVQWYRDNPPGHA